MDFSLFSLLLTGVVSSVKDAFGHIDIVVDTAGVVRESDWEQTLQINLVGDQPFQS